MISGMGLSAVSWVGIALFHNVSILVVALISCVEIMLPLLDANLICEELNGSRVLARIVI